MGFLLSGTFELTNCEKHSTGTIDVELKWRFAYLPPSGTAIAADLANYIQNEKSMEIKSPVKEEVHTPALITSFSTSAAVSNLANSQYLRDLRDIL